MGVQLLSENMRYPVNSLTLSQHKLTVWAGLLAGFLQGYDPFLIE